MSGITIVSFYPNLSQIMDSFISMVKTFNNTKSADSLKLKSLSNVRKCWLAILLGAVEEKTCDYPISNNRLYICDDCLRLRYWKISSYNVL